MEWIEAFQDALSYIEEHLTEEIDFREPAKKACCPVYHFQRMFACMTGVPVSEYIRRRRMSLAALDLKDGKEKVIDTAMKYGYGSPTAFNRAFKSVHGIAPSEAKRKGANLKFYPPVSFRIIVKGVDELDYRMERKEAFDIVGVSMPLAKEMELNFAKVPGFWEKAAVDGTIRMLTEQMGQEMRGVLGVSICKDEEEWRYMIGVCSKERPSEMSGYKRYEIPAHTWAVFPGKGVCPEAIQELEKRIFTEWLPSSGYEYDNGPDLELYKTPDPDKAEFEVWIPVRKKQK